MATDKQILGKGGEILVESIVHVRDVNILEYPENYYEELEDK